MAFTLSIETSNAAFSDGAAPDEIARILRSVITALEIGTLTPDSEKPLRDVNGNRVGAVHFEEIEEG